MPRVPTLHAVTYLLHALPATGKAAKRHKKIERETTVAVAMWKPKMKQREMRFSMLRIDQQ